VNLMKNIRKETDKQKLKRQTTENNNKKTEKETEIILKNMETNEKAFYEIFTLSEYYRAMKIVETDVLKIIMMTSLIERLNSERDFLTFPEWLTTKEQENDAGTNKKIKQIFNKYAKEHGCSGKFRRFFQNFITKKEKVELIKSVRFFPKLKSGLNSPNLFPLFCFEESRCNPPPLQSCPLVNYDQQDCLICSDAQELKKVLDEFAEFLYTLRSKFVHDARMFALASPNTVTHDNGATLSMSLWTYIDYNFRKLKREKYEGLIMLDLTTRHLEGILKCNFKKMLDNFVRLREPKESALPSV
jgi:hypothetical protein